MSDIAPPIGGGKQRVRWWSWLAAATTAAFLLFPIVRQWQNRNPREARERRSAAAQPLIAISRDLYQQGMYQRATDAALEALKLDPQSAEAYNNLAVSYLQLRQYDRALSSAKAALMFDPGMELARNNLLWILREEAAHARRPQRATGENREASAPTRPSEP